MTAYSTSYPVAAVCEELGYDYIIKHSSRDTSHLTRQRAVIYELAHKMVVVMRDKDVTALRADRPTSDLVCHPGVWLAYQNVQRLDGPPYADLVMRKLWIALADSILENR